MRLDRTTVCCMLLALFTIGSGTAQAEVTFEVVLEGFTDNPVTENISYVRMYINFTSPVDFTSAGIAGACAGWSEATESGMWNGPSIFMAAHDPFGSQQRPFPEYELQDGRMFWVDAGSAVTGVSAIQIWNAADIGDNGANLYPGTIELVELTGSRAVFSAASVPNRASTWGRIKALYR